MTRNEMKAAIAAGGSVLYSGRIITDEADLPKAEELAATAEEKADIAAELRKDIGEMRERLTALGARDDYATLFAQYQAEVGKREASDRTALEANQAAQALRAELDKARAENADLAAKVEKLSKDLGAARQRPATPAPDKPADAPPAGN